MARLDEIKFIGSGLNRPECVLTHQSGLLITADWTDSGGISLVGQDGVVSRLLAKDAPRQMRPNGVALEPGGSVLLADLGVEDGGVWRLHSDGHVEPVIIDIAGHMLPPTNFVLRDIEERLWITVMRLDGYGNLFERALRSNEWQTITFEKSDSGFGRDSVYRLQRHVIDHLVNGGPVANSAQDYIANLIIEDSIYRSATSQCVQEISL